MLMVFTTLPATLIEQCPFDERLGSADSISVYLLKLSCVFPPVNLH